jgi:hypothetical protein
MSKIKSFQGRRLIAELTVEEVADKLSVPVQKIKLIEANEKLIQKMDEMYDEISEN